MILQNSSRHFPNSTTIITRYSDTKPFDFTLTTTADKRVQSSLKGVRFSGKKFKINLEYPQLTLTGFDIIRPSDKRIERQYYRPADATNNITEYNSKQSHEVFRYNAVQLTTQTVDSYKIDHPIIYTGETIRFYLYDSRLNMAI